MKLFKALKLKNSGQVCGKCAYFQGDPAHIEEAYPGLSIMSSGYASVRAKDGLCSYNQLYLSAHDSCPHFTPRTAVLADIVI